MKWLGEILPIGFPVSLATLEEVRTVFPEIDYVPGSVQVGVKIKGQVCIVNRDQIL